MIGSFIRLVRESIDQHFENWLSASAAGSDYDFDGAVISRSDALSILPRSCLLRTSHPRVSFVYRAVTVVSAPDLVGISIAAHV